MDVTPPPPGEDSHPLTLLMRHDSQLRIPERGFVGAHVSLGFDLESYPDTTGRVHLVRLAAEAGIEARIQY